MPSDRDPSLNVFGESLIPCSTDPMTGFFRDGCCNTSEQDVGSHTVCVVLTDDFLEFSKSKGNDLTTPMPAYGFPGLKGGERWCLCARRWLEAYRAGKAPKVILRSTHQRALEVIEMDILRKFAFDLH
jgi:uncharacterized protein (DUF2237 family)